MKRAITFGTVVLCLCLAAPASFSQQPSNPPPQSAQAKKPPASQQDVPAEIQSAREKLTSARNDLVHAGGEWGGFKESAIGKIDEAQAALSKALEFRQKNMKK